MKVLRNWLENWVDLSGISNKELLTLFESIGYEIESYKSLDPNYKHIIIGTIIDIQDIPKAKKIRLVKVNIGKEVLSIICGAPNVKSNITVPVAKTGAVIGDSKIKKTKIRGTISNGMICSGKELALNDYHDGILILDDSLKPGEGL